MADPKQTFDADQLLAAARNIAAAAVAFYTEVLSLQKDVDLARELTKVWLVEVLRPRPPEADKA